MNLKENLRSIRRFFRYFFLILKEFHLKHIFQISPLVLKNKSMNLMKHYLFTYYIKKYDVNKY